MKFYYLIIIVDRDGDKKDPYTMLHLAHLSRIKMIKDHNNVEENGDYAGRIYLIPPASGK